MAAVWAARLKGSRGFQKTLAVKTMLGSLGGASSEPFEEMFLDEARIASRIRHPNVAEIFDLGEENEVLYIVMEWVDGEPLSTISRAAQKQNQPMPLPVAVRIAADALAGLHAAHELRDDDGKPIGLVHRDVSPQNILVSYDGATKIVDFGVALQGRESERTATAGDKVKGKVPYMSPEQALGKPIDRRTDVFAMGIVLYQLTTGRHPFRADSDIATLRNILDLPADPPSMHVPGFPRPLEQALLKALDKDPNQRFQSAAEFEAALDRVLPPSAPRVRTSDIAKFVRDTVGERGDRRRDAIRAAVKQADDMVAEGRSGESLPALRLSSQHPVTNPTATGLATSAAPPPFEQQEDNGRGKIAILAVLAVVAAVVVGALALRPASSGPRGTGMGVAAGTGTGTSGGAPSAGTTAEPASSAATSAPPASGSGAGNPASPPSSGSAPGGDAVDLDALPPEQRHWKKGGGKPPGPNPTVEPPPPATTAAVTTPPVKPPPPKPTGAVPPIVDPGF
jgi:serine/threonine-protein kinase